MVTRTSGVFALLLLLIGHKIEIRRTLFLEVSGKNELEILIELRVPSGEPRRALSVLADQNHDGRIDESEEKSMRRMLALRALDGIQLVAGSSTISIDNMETKLKVDRDQGPIDLAVHGVAVLPVRSRDLELMITTAAVGDPLDLVVLPGKRPVIAADHGRIRDGGLKQTLGLGDRTRIRLADLP